MSYVPPKPSHCSRLVRSIFSIPVTITALPSAPGLPKPSQHCSFTGPAHGAGWCILCSPLPFRGLCSTIQRLVWAPRPKWCALSLQLVAAVYRLGCAWWPAFPVSCTGRLGKVFVLLQQILLMIFHKFWWQVWEALVSLLSSVCPLVSHKASALLENVWLNLPSLCLEFVEHQVFYVSHVRTGLLLKNCESLILLTTLRL